jgi:hypothetical protein
MSGETSLTRSRRSAPSSSCTSLRLRLLSQSLEILSDDPATLDVLRFQYRHFLERSPARRPDQRIQLKLGGPRPALVVGSKRLALPRDCSSGHALSLVLESLIDTIREHLVFHAGAVSQDGRGLLVCGPPGFGKTSLVLELSRRGCGFLSDDYAPVSLREARLHPFPRSLGIVAGTPAARRLVRSVAPGGRLRVQEKWLVDPAALPGLRLAGSCRPAAVVLLGPPSLPSPARPLHYDLAIDESLAASLRRHLPGAGFSRARRSPSGRVRLRLTLPPGHRLASRLEGWVARHRAHVFTMERVHRKAGAFGARFTLRPVHPSEGLVEVLSDLHNRRPGSAALAQGEMSAGGLLMASARLLGQARFVRFSGGTPFRRAEAALALLRSSGGRS